MEIDGAIFALIGPTQIMWIAIVVLVLFGARKVPDMRRGMGMGWRDFRRSFRFSQDQLVDELWAAGQEHETDLVAEALTPDNRSAEFLLKPEAKTEDVKSQLIVWVAQGFGIGRIPFAPGTWGSVLGVVWSVLLLRYCSPILFVSLVLLSSLLAVWICGEAEEILGVSDPGSVVLDEIVAMPLAYFGVELLSAKSSAGGWGMALFERPGASMALTPGLLLFLTIGFALFRLFDIWKPWPIRRLQYLPGGWGVVVDDLAAALVAGLIFLLGLAAVLPIVSPMVR